MTGLPGQTLDSIRRDLDILDSLLFGAPALFIYANSLLAPP